MVDEMGVKWVEKKVSKMVGGMAALTVAKTAVMKVLLD
jgi:hypothetical protein